MADRVTRAADAAIEVAFRCYAGRVSYARNAEALEVISEELAVAQGVTRTAAAEAVNEAIRRRVAA